MGSPDYGRGGSAACGISCTSCYREDAQLVAQLRTTYQAEDGDPGVITADEQLNDWQRMNLAEDTVLVLARRTSGCPWRDLARPLPARLGVWWRPSAAPPPWTGRASRPLGRCLGARPPGPGACRCADYGPPLRQHAQ